MEKPSRQPVFPADKLDESRRLMADAMERMWPVAEAEFRRAWADELAVTSVLFGSSGAIISFDDGGIQIKAVPPERLAGFLDLD